MPMNDNDKKILRSKFKNFVRGYLSSKTAFEIKIPRKKGEYYCQKIEEAIRENKSIFIFGDYDADGLVSTTYKKEMIEKLAEVMGKDIEVDYKIPTRGEHYGIKYEQFKYYIQEYDLVITSDNGTHASFYNSLTEEDFKKIIIVDHHPLIDPSEENKRSVEEFQSHINVINPNIDGSVKISTGMLDEALFSIMREYFPELKKVTAANEFSDLAAITLISDMADRNNPIVRTTINKGLQRMNMRERAMYKYLFPTFNSSTIHQINEEDIGFLVAPLLNSGPRMSNAVDGIPLAITAKEIDNRFLVLMDTLVYTNEIRKEATNEYTKRAEIEVDKILEDSPNANLIVVKIDECPIGINGLIAGNITQKYGIPTIMVSQNIYAPAKSNGDYGDVELEYLGSGRGEGVKQLMTHFHSLSTEAKESVNFGGHNMAIGINIPSWDEFKTELDAFNSKPFQGLNLSNHIVFNEDAITVEEYKVLCAEYGDMSKGVTLSDSLYAKVKATVVGFNEYRNNFKKIILSQDNGETISLITKAPNTIDLKDMDEIEIAIVITAGNKEDGRFADILSIESLRPDLNLISNISQ